MSDFIQMDIFFFITSIFVTILTIILALSAYFIFKTLRQVQKIVDTIKELVEELRREGSATIASFSDLRSRAESSLKNAKGMTSFISLVAVGIVSRTIETLIKGKGRKK